MSNLYKFLAAMIVVACVSISGFSQSVGISNTTIVPDATAILDLVSDSKGLLIPRLSVAERDAIVSPANSLIIYNTTSRCLEIYTDGAWQSFYCSCPVLDPLQPIVGPSAVCSGSTVSFSVPGVTGAADYTWTVSGVPSGSITGNGSTTISFPAPNSNTFTVEVTAANACTNSTSYQSTTVNAYTAVPPTPTASSAPSAICQGSGYGYSIVSNIGVNGTTSIDYTWTVTTTGTASATITANSQTAVAGSPASYTSTATAITVNVGSTGSGNVTVSVVGNNTCGASASALSWTLPVNELSADPTSATAGSATICNGQSTNLTLNGGGGGTNEVIRWYTSSCGGTLVGSGNGLLVSPTTTTTYYGRYEDPAPCNYNSNCQSVTVTVDQLSIAPTTISGPSGICDGASANLSVSDGFLGTGAIIEWFTGSCGGTPAGTGPNITVFPTSNTTYFVRYNGNCNTTTCAQLSVTVDQFTAANAGPDQTLCSTTATLAGNAPTTGVGTWTLVSGSGTITSPNSPTSGITGLGVGANVFRWTLPNGGCTDSQDEVTITGQSSSTIPTGITGTTSICSGASTTLSVDGGTAGTGAVAEWFTGSCGGTPAGTGPSISVSPAVNTTYFVRYSGTCNTTNCVSQLVTVDQFTTADAGSDQAVCATTATLAGNTPTTGGGTWTLVSGTGTITTPTSPTSGITGLGVGANVFRWTLPNGGCTDSQDEVTITGQSSSSLPTGITGATTICSGSPTTLFVSGGTPGTGAVVEWFTGSCGGTPAGTGSSISVSPAVNTTYYVRYNGTCNTTSCADQLVTVDQSTTANAGSDQALCASSATLSGNAPATGSGTWSVVGGSGTVTAVNNPSSTVTSLGAGANTFRWTLPNGTCPDDFDDVVITSDVFTAANAGTDQTICSSSATFGGNSPTSGTGTWTVQSGSGSITSSSLPNSTVTSLGLGSNTFRWTLSNGTCADDFDEVTITSDDYTAASAGADQTVCGTSATLAGNAPSTGVGTWTVISGAGTFTNANSPTTTVTSLGAGANTFRWTLPNGSCANDFDEVVITSHVYVAAAAGPDQTVCVNSATLAGNAPTTGTGTWTVISGSGNFSDANSPTSTVSSLGTGTNTFRWTLLNGSCADDFDEVTITQNTPSTDPTGILGTLNISSGSTTTLTVDGGSIGTGGTVEWYTGSCGGTSVHTGASYTTPALTADTQYWVRYEDACGNSNCVTATVVVTTGCTHTIRLYDTFGDGWHGNNFVTVNVNGTPVLTNITLTNTGPIDNWGDGPMDFTFTADDGDAISVTYTAGSWAYECRYTITSGAGTTLVNQWNPSASGTWNGTGNCTPCTNDPSSSVSYSASNTWFATNGNVTTHDVDLCEGATLTFGCGVAGSTASGDQYFRLYYNGTQVAANDDACGLNSNISYTVPAGAAGTYQMWLGCYWNNTCSGTINYTIAP